MFGYYTPIMILQAFCLYHAYKNHAEQRWYWLIIFFPGIGGLIYLYSNFYSRRGIQNLAEGVKEVVNSNYRLEQLEKALRFSNNFSNKMNLADAYVKYRRFKEAIILYNECLTGFMAEDPTIQMKVLNAYFLDGDYESTVVCGNKLESEKTFIHAEERVAYAWALHYQDKTILAKKVFEGMNRTFSNYKHRLEYCKFLRDTNDDGRLRDTLITLVEEIEHIKGQERKLMRDVAREIHDLYVVHVRN